MPDFSLKSRDEGDIVILETNGYLNNLGGEEVAKACYKRINEGKKKFLLNQATMELLLLEHRSKPKMLLILIVITYL